METLVFKTSETYNILVKFNEPIGNVDKNEIDQLNVRYARMFADTKVLEVHIRNNIDEILSKIWIKRKMTQLHDKYKTNLQKLWTITELSRVLFMSKTYFFSLPQESFLWAFFIEIERNIHNERAHVVGFMNSK